MGERYSSEDTSSSCGKASHTPSKYSHEPKLGKFNKERKKLTTSTELLMLIQSPEIPIEWWPHSKARIICT